MLWLFGQVGAIDIGVFICAVCHMERIGFITSCSLAIVSLCGTISLSVIEDYIGLWSANVYDTIYVCIITKIQLFFCRPLYLLNGVLLTSLNSEGVGRLSCLHVHVVNISL